MKFIDIMKDLYKVSDVVIVKGYSDYYNGIPLRISNIYKGFNDNLYCNFECPKGLKKKWRSGHNFNIDKIVYKLSETYEIY